MPRRHDLALVHVEAARVHVAPGDELGDAGNVLRTELGARQRADVHARPAARADESVPFLLRHRVLHSGRRARKRFLRGIRRSADRAGIRRESAISDSLSFLPASARSAKPRARRRGGRGGRVEAPDRGGILQEDRWPRAASRPAEAHRRRCTTSRARRACRSRRRPARSTAARARSTRSTASACSRPPPASTTPPTSRRRPSRAAPRRPSRCSSPTSPTPTSRRSRRASSPRPTRLGSSSRWRRPSATPSASSSSCARLRGQRPRVMILAGSRPTSDPTEGALGEELRAYERSGGLVVLISRNELDLRTVLVENLAGAEALARALVEHRLPAIRGHHRRRGTAHGGRPRRGLPRRAWPGRAANCATTT